MPEKTKLFHKNFVLSRDLIDSSGDSVWNVIPKTSNSTQFVIHVRNNNSLYVTFFRHKYKSEKTAVDINIVTDALLILCRYLKSQGENTPTIWIKPPNKFLFTAARRAGMKICGPRRSLLKYK